MKKNYKNLPSRKCFIENMYMSTKALTHIFLSILVYTQKIKNRITLLRVKLQLSMYVQNVK